MPAQEGSRRYRFADLELDPERHRLRRGRSTIQLSDRLLNLLRVLVEKSPAVVSHDELADRVWGERRIVTPENLAQHIAMLRRSLGDDAAAPTYVEAVRGKGYRLVPEVHAWSSDQAVPRRLLPAALALAAIAIAAFVAGLAVQSGYREAGRHSVEFTDQWGQLFNFSVFFLFGMLAVRALPEFRWTHWLYAVASLSVVRMAPVALALAGTRLSPATIGFMGWFGPRGLASIVLGLVYLEQEASLPGEDTIRLTVLATVCLSIFAHGLSALPAIRLYANHVARLPADAPERVESESDCRPNAAK